MTGAYTELYWPGYDGEVVLSLYGNWHDVPGYDEKRLQKGHATYCGEITMVDTWLGFLLKSIENMGLMNKTAIIFTTDHEFLLWGTWRPLRQDELSQVLGRDASALWRPRIKVGVLSPFRGACPPPTSDSRAGSISRGIQRPEFRRRCHADRTRSARDGDSRLRSRQVSCARNARYFHPRPGVRSQQHSLREPWRSGSFRGQLAPSPLRPSGHHHHFRREEFAIQPSRWSIRALQSEVRSKSDE